MIALEDLTTKARVAGLVQGQMATIVAVDWHGNDTVEVVYRTDDGQVSSRLLTRADQERLSIEKERRLWTLHADGELFKLAAEARRIKLAHLFDPYVAVETSTIEPLPHQIEAVYQEMLPRQPLRFLLADDPGAGKTIMSGLLIRELVVRGDVMRCLIVAPGSLVEQWQDEMLQKFGMRFTILSRDLVEAAATGNPFAEHNFLIVRVDQLARNDDLQLKLNATTWDLAIVDEAHKLSAHYFGSELKKTKRFQVGELLRDRSRHLVFLTATPHNGKDEDFQLFLSLLDPDRFAGRLRGRDVPDASDMMRRYVKEKLLTFEGKPLFPERRSVTAMYELSKLETGLYESVTDYVREGMNRAQALEEGGDRKRGLVVGFALTSLQRRLASSPEAIYRSIQRRRERLEKQVAELEALGDMGARQRLAAVDLPKGLAIGDLEDFDPDDFGDEELERLEDQVLDAATAAATITELQAEIQQLAALEKIAHAVRISGTDKKWEQLSSILQSSVMTNPAGVRRKLIVFTEYKDTLLYLQTKIASLFGNPERVVAIHGGLNREERRRIQESFTNDPDVWVLVATDAAGEGVNLQRANLMVNYDLPWNPNRIEQRFGRIHRIGQTEVCHLWNLVAHGTREGDVFEKLLDKIEAQRQRLGDQVYDVLGDAIINRELRDLLIEAIRYGELPEVRARLDQVIDDKVGKRLEEVVKERALGSGLLSHLRVREIRDAMERAQARKLQPGFIKAFFVAALQHLGGRITEREADRFEITRVPAAIRARDKELLVGAPLATAYERVTFEKDKVVLEGKPRAELIAPGHPLLTAVIETILERHGSTLTAGTILIDPDSANRELSALVTLEHEVQDGRPASGGRRVVSQRLQYVEISTSGTAKDAGYAPYLDYRPISAEERTLILSKLDQDWVGRSLGETARSFAVEHLAADHFDEIRDITVARVTQVKKAVEERLRSEIAYWDRKAAEIKELELQGKRRGGQTSGHARQIADDLEARLERRLRELDLELDLSNQPPRVVSGAVIVPQGLLDELVGAQPSRPVQHARDVEEVDRRAVAAVLEAERHLGRDAREMDHANPGYDIETRDPETGTLYFIEVKGRIEGQETVNVKTRQMRQALNNRDRFVLALVVVPEDPDASPQVRYVLDPFHGAEPAFGEVSRNFSLKELWNIGFDPFEVT